MRLLIFAFMIALLPLRGWFGDAMATDMALAQLQQHQPSATEIIASSAHKMGAEGHIDHEAAAPEAVHDCAGQDADEKAHAASAHCESCSACQACHTVALSYTASSLKPVFSSLTLPRVRAAQFASADAALGQKPPIS